MGAERKKSVSYSCQYPLYLQRVHNIQKTDMELYTISIEQLSQRIQHSGFCFRNHLFVTDHIEDVERFKSPCRIDAITVLVCTGGEVDCSVNLRRYHISSNMILVNFPDDIIQIHQAEGLEAYAVLISSDYLNQLEIDFGQQSDFYLNVRQNAACSLPPTEIASLKPYYSILNGHIKNWRAETPEIVRGAVHAFSYTIISVMRLYQAKEDTGIGIARNKQLFNKFMALVKQHHARVRGVKFYADKLFLTPNYLSGAVKEYTGKAAGEWVDKYAILEAEIMLRNSDESIQQIAWKLNFPNQSAFGKWFKKRVGVCPRLYRRGVAETDD